AAHVSGTPECTQPRPCPTPAAPGLGDVHALLHVRCGSRRLRDCPPQGVPRGDHDAAIRRGGTAAARPRSIGWTSLMADDRPIGVFDSGIGGLTVVRELLHRLPGESIS